MVLKGRKHHTYHLTEKVEKELGRQIINKVSGRYYSIMPGEVTGEKFGYKIRNPYESELDYFSKNKNVAGMASDDGMIVLNPHSSLNEKEMQAVSQNEAARLWMRKHNFRPNFDLTLEQRDFFKGTPYEHDLSSARETIIGRIISGDPSAKDATISQKAHAEYILNHLRKRGK
jgi:hypothetical protein